MTPPNHRDPAPQPAPDIRLVALDLDGTLLRTDKRLTQKTANAVADVIAAGVHVVLASARPPRSVRETYETLRLDTPQINYNGALIHHPAKRRPIFHQPLAAALAMRIVRAARRLDPTVFVSVEILDRWYTDYCDDTLQTETAKHFKPDFVGPLESFLHVPVTKLMFLTPPAQLTDLHETLHDKFASDVNLIITDQHLIQILHPDADKANALERIANNYHIPRHQVMAVGDAPNDTEMLRWAGLGVAMENAWPQVREAADIIAPSNDDYGVEFALRRYVLGQTD